MAFYSKLRGTIETLFQLGNGGPNWKNNAGAIEARNAADSAFAIVRGLTPSGTTDLTTKAYVDGKLQLAKSFNNSGSTINWAGGGFTTIINPTMAITNAGQVVFHYTIPISWTGASGCTLETFAAVDSNSIDSSFQTYTLPLAAGSGSLDWVGVVTGITAATHNFGIFIQITAGSVTTGTISAGPGTMANMTILPQS